MLCVMKIELSFNHINLLEYSDIKEVMLLVDEGKKYMHSIGNFQWDDVYPLQKTFEKDIELQKLYGISYNNTMAGFICLNMAQPLEYKPIYWNTPEKSLVIHRMVTNRKYAGQGVGRFLMRFAEYYAKSHGIGSIRSDTNSKNAPMIHLFETLGYAFTGHIILRNKPDLFRCYDKNL